MHVYVCKLHHTNYGAILNIEYSSITRLINSGSLKGNHLLVVAYTMLKAY